MRFSFLTLIALTALAVNLPAQESASPVEVVGGLTNPCGVAVQPGTGHVFVSDSGALRVGRVSGSKLEDVITSSPKDTFGKGPFYDIGPLGLAFTSDGKSLIVGDGGYKDGEECIRVYTVPESGNAPTAGSAPALASTWLPFTRSPRRCSREARRA